MKILDVWFTKPVLFMSSGRWCCQSMRADEWRVTGNGPTPTAAFDHMKRLRKDFLASGFKRRRKPTRRSRR
jgi:hypothetical protein